jgi:alkaline phosphatase
VIGDGMGLAHINAGMLTSGKQYSFMNWQSTLSNTDSVDSNGTGAILTDSAAGGTALASGQLTVNGYVGKDHTGADVVTILDRAASLGKATGVVTTDTLFGATPGAFSAHTLSRDDSNGLFTSQLSSGINLLCGTKDPITSNIPLIAAAGYDYCDDPDDLEDTFAYDKVYWQLELASANPSVRLCDATVKALEYLDRDEDGFVIMVEQAHIDKYSHSNEFANMAACANSLNDTVEAILSWIGDRTDTAVLITADHETGGLSVSQSDLGGGSYKTSSGTTVYYKWTSSGHTRADVGVFVYGVKADFAALSKYGTADRIKNTNVYDLMLDILTRPSHYGGE